MCSRLGGGGNGIFARRGDFSSFNYLPFYMRNSYQVKVSISQSVRGCRMRTKPAVWLVGCWAASWAPRPRPAPRPSHNGGLSVAYAWSLATVRPGGLTYQAPFSFRVLVIDSEGPAVRPINMNS